MGGILVNIKQHQAGLNGSHWTRKYIMQTSISTQGKDGRNGAHFPFVKRIGHQTTFKNEKNVDKRNNLLFKKMFEEFSYL